ncbi:MAG: ArsA-related P-loop ATPase, partial [Pseudomonadota bacterium]
IVLDAYSTGHFRALLNAPVGMAEAVGFGPMGEQSRGISETLQRKDITTVYIVSLPEELPVKETLELHAFLKNRYQQEATVIMNKSLHEKFELAEVSQLTKELEQSAVSVDSKRYLSFLSEKLSDEREFREELPQETKGLEHQYLPTSVELYQKVADRLREVLDA